MISGSGNTFLKSPSVTFFFLFPFISLYFFLSSFLLSLFSFLFSPLPHSILLICSVTWTVVVTTMRKNMLELSFLSISPFFSFFLFFSFSLSLVSQKRRRVNRKIFLLSLSLFSQKEVEREDKEEKGERKKERKKRERGR